MHAEKKSTFTNNLNGLKELPEYVLKVLIEKKILHFLKKVTIFICHSNKISSKKCDSN